MVNFPLLPSVCHPLSRCSLPLSASAVSVQRLSSNDSTRFFPRECPRKGRLYRVCFAHTRQQFVVPVRAPSVVKKVRKFSRAQADHALNSKSSCVSSSRIVGLKGNANIQLPTLGCWRSFDITFEDATRKASTSEGVECVKEDEDVRNCPTEKESSQRSDLVMNEDDVRLLAQYMTRHNFVRVLEVSRSADSVLAGARVLLLDKPGNVHSIYQKDRLLTESYYDIFAAFPAVVPQGPIGILGLGAGTAARLINHFWPEVDMHGWELDLGVVQAARKFFDLEVIEWKDGIVIGAQNAKPVIRRRNSSGSYGAWKDESDEVRLHLFQGMRETQGKLRVHVGDALHPTAIVEGGFAGLIVDLFAEGAVIPALQQVETWRQMREKLQPGGRIIVNCGGSCVEAAGVEKKDGGITMKETIAALAVAFPGELSITNLRGQGDNSIALTGPSPDFQLWKDSLPECLRRGMEDWRAFPRSSSQSSETKKQGMKH